MYLNNDTINILFFFFFFFFFGGVLVVTLTIKVIIKSINIYMKIKSLFLISVLRVLILNWVYVNII